MRGIYSITNIITNTVYFGQAINISKRFREHKSSLSYGSHGNEYLQRAWNKYGKNAFVFTPVEIIEDVNIPLTPIEQKYFDSTSNKYNIREPEMKAPLSEETKQKIGFSNRNTLHPVGWSHSKETKEKMSKTHKGRKYRLGQTNSKEHNKKISVSHKGNKNPMFGKVVSSETKRKLSLATKRYWDSKRGANGNL